MPRYSWVLGDVVKRASTRCLLGELRFRPLADIPNDYSLITRPSSANSSPICLHTNWCALAPHGDRSQPQGDVTCNVMPRIAPSLVETVGSPRTAGRPPSPCGRDGRASAPDLCSVPPRGTGRCGGEGGPWAPPHGEDGQRFSERGRLGAQQLWAAAREPQPASPRGCVFEARPDRRALLHQ